MSLLKRRSRYDNDDTIAAISTPVGEGGIGIVRISGKNALTIADKIFLSKGKAKPSQFKTFTTHYGHIVRHASCVMRHAQETHHLTQYACLPTAGERNTQYEVVDEVILTVMRAPKSYTKEDIVEINCHGGIVPLRKVLELALTLGARLAEPGEFTKRAFLNGRIDLAQAEAVLDVIRSKTESSMKVALGQLEGELSTRVKYFKNVLTDILSEIEAEIDFSEEDIEPTPKKEIARKLKDISQGIKKLIDEAWKGMIIKEGILCVICGKPNVGKSSLMNTLLRKRRVIVTPIPGTTRDAIEETVNLKGIAIRIVDTAGIAAAKDIVEKHGIKKSKSYIKLADLLLFMLDLSKPWAKQDVDIFNSIKGKNFIVLANKSDLKRRLDLNKVKKLIGKNTLVEISLLRKNTLDKVEGTILDRIWRGEVLQPEGAFVTNLRQKKDLETGHLALTKAVKALETNPDTSMEILASDINEAISSLSSLLGETVEPDILERIFSKFCVGK